jgi:glycosyltransferase involved in cell wall biosynthesis
MSNPQIGKTVRKYFIQEHLHKEVFHGGVGNIDIERILVSEGFIPIIFPYHFDFSLKAKCLRYLYLFKVLFTIPAGSIIFFQFPLYARMHELLVRMLAFRNSIRVICLVADINGLKDGDGQVLRKELALLNRFTFFIVHEKPMENWLKKQVPHAIISHLRFFDFLTSPVNVNREKASVIAFAGNLAKSPFLENLHLVAAKKALTFHIYGPDGTAAMMQQAHVHFKGVHPPYALPALIDGSFGLLWDGESIEGAGGSLGDYMQYITHHKLSLYVLAGLPVIAYAHAGSADMIRNLRIGFTVSTLYDLGEKLEGISDDDYRQMIANMKPVADRIASGRNLKDALNELIQLMNE